MNSLDAFFYVELVNTRKTIEMDYGHLNRNRLILFQNRLHAVYVNEIHVSATSSSWLT